MQQTRDAADSGLSAADLEAPPTEQNLHNSADTLAPLHAHARSRPDKKER